jgi:predicted transposase YbfD/YdcC
MEADFPFARSLIIMRTERTLKKTAQTTTESHYYLSSLPPDHYSPSQWLNLIRGHWGGVENRNHWRRDALMGEDRSRSRNPNLLANLALIRSILLARLADQIPDQPLPIVFETFASQPARALTLLRS